MYSLEEEELIRVLYEELGNAGLKQIANKINKSERSVRSKLVKMKLYRATEPVHKVGKKQLVKEIEDHLGYTCVSLERIDKALLEKLHSELTSD